MTHPGPVSVGFTGYRSNDSFTHAVGCPVALAVGLSVASRVGAVVWSGLAELRSDRRWRTLPVREKGPGFPQSAIRGLAPEAKFHWELRALDQRL